MAETDTLRDNTEILRELSKRDEIADDLVSRATVTGEHVETISAAVVEGLTVRDKVRNEELPAHKYLEIKKWGVPIDERFDDQPSGYVGHDVEFYDPDFSVETCSKCDGETKTTCTKCTGDGDVTCPECSGEKRFTCENCGGAGEFECSRCSNGTESCSKCGGSGSVDVYGDRQCGRCGGATRHNCPKCGGNGEDTDGDDCRTCWGEGLVDCDECTGGTIEKKIGTRDCDRCNASGRVDCSNCGGSEIDRQCGECSGRGTIRCSECRGTGTLQCDNCSGAGEVECSRCNGSGDTVTAEHGTVEYNRTEYTSFDTDQISTQYLRDSDIDAFGTHQGDTVTIDGELPKKGKKTTFRERKEKYTLPGKMVWYEYDGKRYLAVQIGEDVRVDDYPHSPDHLAERIDDAKGNSRFTPGDGGTVGGGIIGGLKLSGIELGFAIAAAVVGLIVVAIGTVLTGIAGWVFDLGGVRDLFVFGGVILAMMIAGWSRLRFVAVNSSGKDSTFTVLHLLIPLGAVGAAFVALEAGLLEPRAGLLALTIAVTIWVGVVARLTLFERDRRLYADEQATNFLRELGVGWKTLEKHELAGRVPGGPEDVDTSRQQLCARGAYFVIWPVAASIVTLMAIVFLAGFPPGISSNHLLAANGALFGAVTVLFGTAKAL